MTVLTTSKIGAGRIRRLREGRPAAPVERDPGITPAVHVTPGHLRYATPSQDEAVYSCQCGFVFSAPVSTSVDCPHCGDAQAW